MGSVILEQPPTQRQNFIQADHKTSIENITNKSFETKTEVKK